MVLVIPLLKCSVYKFCNFAFPFGFETNYLFSRVVDVIRYLWFMIKFIMKHGSDYMLSAWTFIEWCYTVIITFKCKMQIILIYVNE